jgi:hypothetical protein
MLALLAALLAAPTVFAAYAGSSPTRNHHNNLAAPAPAWEGSWNVQAEGMAGHGRRLWTSPSAVEAAPITETLSTVCNSL